MKCHVARVGLVLGALFASTFASAQPCLTARPAPLCRSCFITEFGYSYGVTEPFKRTSTQMVGDSVAYVYVDQLTGRNYLTSELGYIYNLNSTYGLGVTHFTGYDIGEGLRGGMKVRLRKWISPKTSLNLSGGAILWGMDLGIEYPAFIAGGSVDFSPWESVSLMVEVMESPPHDVTFDYGAGNIHRNSSPRQRNVGVYLGYKLSSKPGLAFNGIAVAGTGIAFLLLIAAFSGSNWN